MKKTLWLFVVLVVLLPVSLTFAQGDPGQQPVELPDGTQILIPGDWAFEAREDMIYFSRGEYYFSEGAPVELMIYLPDMTAAMFTDPPTADTLLTTMLTDVLEKEVDAELIGAHGEGVEYLFETEDGQWLAVAQPWGDGQLFYVFHAPADEFEAVQVVVDGILSQLPAASAAGAPVECFIGANKDYGVPLRLGPGLNRGEY
jgi:hypothetical protein